MNDLFRDSIAEEGSRMTASHWPKIVAVLSLLIGSHVADAQVEAR